MTSTPSLANGTASRGLEPPPRHLGPEHDQWHARQLAEFRAGIDSEEMRRWYDQTMAEFRAEMALLTPKD